MYVINLMMLFDMNSRCLYRCSLEDSKKWYLDAILTYIVKDDDDEFLL